LYIDELKDLYIAENQLVNALPKFAKAAFESLERKSERQEVRRQGGPGKGGRRSHGGRL
jgi:ferritin-like metal-binding protein YciE